MESLMSNFSSIGVSVYESTHDCPLTCPFRVSPRSRVHTGHMAEDPGCTLGTWPRIQGAHWAHEGRWGTRGTVRSAATCDGHGAGRLRAPPPVRALAVCAHSPCL